VNNLNQENARNIFLATTALEDFWDKTKSIVFLGDWCCRYNRRNIWESLNGEILPGIWNDKKRFIDAYMYLQDVYERLLQQMVVLLNEVHEEKYGIRYWRIIIGPWLFHYIDNLYDRYLCIKMAKSKYPFFDTIVLSEESFVTPLSTLEYLSLSFDDPYNLQVYSRILAAEDNNFRQKKLNIIDREVEPIRTKNRLAIVKEKLIKACMWSIECVKSDKTVYLVGPYFLKSSIIKMFLKSKGKVRPVLSTTEVLPIVTANKNMRSSFAKIFLNHNAFEKLIVQLLPYDIPYSFLESYKMIKKESLRYPSKPHAIVSWVAWYFDEKFKLWAAMAAESGSALYGVQHGGNYGIDQYMQALDHEVAITDKYYSWGWTYPEIYERVVPMPVSIINEMKRVKRPKNNNILFAGTAPYRYFYRLEYPTNNYSEKYCQDQIIFFKQLDLSCQKNIRYRPFNQDFGLNVSQRIQDEFPNLIVEAWDTPFQESLLNCKLFVCDHLSTVHAEALSSNIPTILFWDPESMICRKEARICLDQLRKVGILHDSPESSAKMVNEVYDNVDDWWYDDERQSARIKFCDHYVKTSSKAIVEWTNEFNNICR
jgi:putative transferase (TIGR04331 family)